ncbi:hypothetical protein ACHAXT_010693 [Thalassiosira profunda]
MATFRGFSEFADLSSSTTRAVARARRGGPQKNEEEGGDRPPSSSSSAAPALLRPSPVYAGSDEGLALLFRKVGKRDPKTKARALEELAAAAFPPAGADTNAPSSPATALPRRERAAVLAALAHQHASRLGHDNAAAVRAASWAALAAARRHVPRAWGALFLGLPPGGGDGAAAHDDDNRHHSNGNASECWVAGMAWCAAAPGGGDPAAEVARKAGAFVAELLAAEAGGGAEDGNGGAPGPRVRGSVCRYARLVLGCRRPSAFQEAINPSAASAKKASSSKAAAAGGKKGKSKKGAGEAAAATGPSAAEREETEERYERAVLSALCGLGQLLDGRPEGGADATANAALRCADFPGFPEAAAIARLLHSARGAFRRGAYALAGKMCARAPARVRGTTAAPAGAPGEEDAALLDLGGAIPALLAAEREPSNVGPLLEMVLGYLAAATKARGGAWGDDGVDAGAFATALGKALRRGCGGAPAAAWGPTMLPLVASLPSFPGGAEADADAEGKPLPLLVVASLWEGRNAAAGAADAVAVVAAVAECATFLLLRRRDVGAFSAEAWRETGQLFLDALSFYLEGASGDAGYGPVAAAVDELGAALARDLRKLDVAAAAVEGEGRGLDVAGSWLWGDEGLGRCLSLDGKANAQGIVRKWDAVLNKMSREEPLSTSTSSNLVPACKALVSSIVDDASASRSNKACTAAEGGALLTTLRFCGVRAVFPIARKGKAEESDAPESIERFCVNDLLRWILVHATTTAASVQTDFEILRLCLEAMGQGQRKQVWATVLRELVKSYCDYTTLSIGLATLAAGDDLVECAVLDAFAMETAEHAVAAFRRSHLLGHGDDEEREESVTRRGNLQRFLETCAGLSKGCPGSSIVSTSVVERWIRLCCDDDRDRRTKLEEDLVLEDESGSNVVLKTLLRACSTSTENTTIPKGDTVQLLCQSWMEGACALPIIDANGALREEVVSLVSSSACDDVRSTPPADHALLELICQAWAKRAVRLIGISQSCDLDSIGLGDAGLWDQAAGEPQREDFLFLCLMYLLHTIDSDGAQLFDQSKSELFVPIQACLVKSAPLLETFASRTKRNLELVDALGGSGRLSKPMLEDCCRQNVDLLSLFMKKDAAPGDETSMAKALTSLSYLVSLVFPTAWHEASSTSEGDDYVIAEEVKQGDSLYYEKGDDQERVKATVLKVHTDDFPNLYFTIKEESTHNERQTVAGRLKRNASPSGNDVAASSDPDDLARRDRLGRCIAERLVKPFLGSMFEDGACSTKREASAEAMNIVISQIGLVDQGIGSVRYEIFQAILAWQRELCENLTPSGPSVEKPSLAKCIPLLRSLSLALGYGVATAPSKGSVHLFKMDASESISKLAELYDDASWVEAQTADRASEAFHSSVLMWIAVADSGSTKHVHLLRTLTNIVSPCESPELAIISYQIMRVLLSSSDSGDNDDEKSVLSELTQCFVKDGKEGLWMESFSSLLYKYQDSPIMLLPAATSASNELCNCLCDPDKRWCAFQLLHLFAKDSQPLQSGDDVVVPYDTERQLALWTEAMEDEEASELEEDVRVASKWLPERLMSLLHSIGSDSASGPGAEDQMMGNLLLWIVFLDVLDSAGSVDMRNRGAISSFAKKTNALGCVMTLALAEADLEVSRNENVFSCIDWEGDRLSRDFLLQKVATLAVFRTVEVLPTHVKTWFNDDCPRFLRQKLSAFVESVVAPATLQRELNRIKEATSFEEMTVSGSCVSREVIATYQQDECQLSVVIRMPSTFPLRNVEVDCQRTMGIPENRWRRWALQIMLMLNSQDGSVLDALLLWKKNVDKEFDGVEPCPVCYSVLCIKTHQMPNLECKTCQNRFHTSCLYKWFQSSGKSQCVLCQQPWSGTRL